MAKARMLAEDVLAVCERHFTAVTGVSVPAWGRDENLETVRIALQTVRSEEQDDYAAVLDAYLEENRPRVDCLWRLYGPAGLYPQGIYHLVESPACLALCHRLDTVPLWLKEVWAQEVGEDTPLERLEEIWLYGTQYVDGLRK